MLLKNSRLIVGKKQFLPTLIAKVGGLGSGDQSGIYFQVENGSHLGEHHPNKHYFVPEGTEDVLEVPFSSHEGVMFWNQFFSSKTGNFQKDLFNKHFTRLTGIVVEGNNRW